jgi:hypothetical protein
MASVAARKLRLHPAPEENIAEQMRPEGPSPGRLRVLVWALAAAVVLGLVGKGYFLSLRYYQAEGRIAVTGLTGDGYAFAMRKHLLGLMTSDLSITPGDDSNTKISFQELMRQGNLYFFPSDSQTISLFVNNSNKFKARKLAEEISSAYVSYVTGTQNARTTKVTGRREKAFSSYKQLQQEHERLKLDMTKLTQGLPKDKPDQVLSSVSEKIQNRIKEAEGMIAKLDKINGEIGVLRDELVHPVLKLDPQRWAEIKNADRLYSGDFRILKVKHGDYLTGLRADMTGLTNALDQLRKLLQSLSEAIGKQLQLQLPEDLSDDLLEMNLAVEKYEGQLARFQERWERYQAKLGELLSEPTQADFDGIGTLLSQLRQDLLQRAGRLPAHLEGLFGQLKQGATGGNLSSLTARQVASSGFSDPMVQIQETWRKLAFHLNRLFPDGNIRLMTMGRVCRSLQWRLNFREKQLKQITEQQLLASQKRETQAKLVVLQKEFEQTSGRLIALYRQFATDQQQLTDLVKRWPELQKLQEALRTTERKMAGMEKDLGAANTAFAPGPEQLEVRPVIVRAASRLGLDPKWESLWSALLAFAGALAVTLYLSPNALRTLREKYLSR